MGNEPKCEEKLDIYNRRSVLKGYVLENQKGALSCYSGNLDCIFLKAYLVRAPYCFSQT